MLKFKLFCVLRVFDRLFPLDFGCCVGLLGVLDFLITVCAEWFVVMVDFWYECFVVVNVACVVLVCFGFPVWLLLVATFLVICCGLLLLVLLLCIWIIAYFVVLAAAVSWLGFGWVGRLRLGCGCLSVFDLVRGCLGLAIACFDVVA